MVSTYHPELDTTPLVDELEATKFRGMVGSCDWLITLGRFDVNCAVNALSRHSMQPREGHVKAMRHVLGYLKRFPSGRIIFDPNQMHHVATAAKSHDEYFAPWKDVHPDLMEDIPPDMPPVPKGRSVKLSCFVHRNDHIHELHPNFVDLQTTEDCGDLHTWL